MSDTPFDLIVIGAGPGGYVAAIRAAQLGLKTAIIDKRAALGGTCLNIGCIPSKALLESTEKFHEAVAGLAAHGVEVGEVKLNLPEMMKRKDAVVSDMTKGVAFLMKKNKITVFTGMGKLTSGTTVEVTAEDGSTQTITGKHLLIATGSEVIELPFLKFDGDRVVSSTEALSLPEVPKHLIVIGAGAIGLELGSVWKRLGADVTVIEAMPTILGTIDRKAGELSQRILTKQGMTFHLGAKVTGAEVAPDGVTLAFTDAKGQPQTLTGDRVLVAVGRRPFADGLGAKEIGVKFTERGRVQVDGHFRTSVATISAIGDVIDGPMLAHKAEEEGVAVAELLAGKPGHVNPDAIPFVVYTWPEIAWVGLSEEGAAERGHTVRTGVFNFSANGRARAMEERDGFVKIIADDATDRILGVFIVGPRASDMIGEAVLAVEFGATAEDLARTVHAHPTLPEVIKEAALAVDKRALHS